MCQFCKSNSLFEKISYILILVGGVDLFFIGLFNINFLSLFGLLGRLIEIVIGLGAGYLIYQFYLCWNASRTKKSEEKPQEPK